MVSPNFGWYPNSARTKGDNSHEIGARGRSPLLKVFTNFHHDTFRAMDEVAVWTIKKKVVALGDLVTASS